jgi:hypothetical protein
VVNLMKILAPLLLVLALPLGAQRPPPAGGAPSGCPGSGGIEPQISALAPPRIGMRSWSVDLGRAYAPSTAWLCVGASTDWWYGVPLPFDAGGGCFLRVGILWVFAAPVQGAGAGGGTASYPVPLVPDPRLIGLPIHAQWLVADPGSASPFGLSFSPLLSTRFV